MLFTQHEIRRGTYYDSVVLMQLQRALLALPDVHDAGVVMTTPANRDLLHANGFDLTNISATPDDLLIIVRATTATAASHALGQIDALLQRKRSADQNEFRPRSMEMAMKQLPQAEWVLVSVPGRFAANVAREALNANKHVFLYSNNVSLGDEVALKQLAHEKGRLVMGPDCGTAIIQGVGLGFANYVRRGNIGCVAASGTGLQLITSEIHRLGAGISHAIGTGGRDLKSDVGGITALQALSALANDPDTQVICFIAKPPAPSVAHALLTFAHSISKPVVINFIGYAPGVRQLGNIHFALTLTECATVAVSLQHAATPSKHITRSPATLNNARFLRGLFSGGTLAYEALLALQNVLSPVYSNAPIQLGQAMAPNDKPNGHVILDMGDDEFTQGRLHPMMDYDLRLRRLRQEMADSACGVILLDVVLGEGSHPNPAVELAPVIKEALALRQDLAIIVFVLGTDADPQNMTEQITQLRLAGAQVFTQSSDALNAVLAHISVNNTQSNQMPISLKSPFAAINVGIESFYDSLRTQGAEVVHVDWRPPALGNDRLAGILARMKK
jgi:FdrA protein